MKTIKSKFIVATILFIIISFGIPFLILMNQFEKNFRQRSVVMLETTLDMLNYGLENAMMLGFQKNIQHILEKIALNKNILHIRILDRNGNILHSSDSLETGKSIMKISPEHIMRNEKITERVISLRASDGVYIALEPIKNEKNCQSCHGNQEYVGLLDIDTNLTEAETSFYIGSLHFIFLGILVAVVLITGFYLIFIYFIDKPLKGFAVAIDKIEKGDLSVRLPALKVDEFGKLEVHFNNMAEELEISRKQIEDFHTEQLIRADRLVTIGELTAQIAHEINNYSAVIMSRADFLNLEAGSNPCLGNYKEDLDAIVNQIGKVSQITNSILKHSKKLSTEFSIVNIEHIIEESLKILYPIFTKRNVKLEKKYSLKNPFILGNAQQIEQVILNIINNGIDAAGNNGRIYIEASESPENNVVLKIHDNGTGIDGNDIEKIFNPFYTTKPPEKGTGLGLYIVKNICKNHKAKINVESENGKGTLFTLIFTQRGVSNV